MSKTCLFAACVLLLASFAPAHADDGPFRLAPFSADITIPIGHPCMGGGIQPAKTIVDPLFAHGFVLLGGDKPVVLVSLDWCEVRNDAYERWREVLAEAAGTDRPHVLVSCIHQHDAPIVDLEAERILRQAKAKESICDLEFHEKAVQRVAVALKESLKKPRPITHFGTGMGKVEKVGSNRRFHHADGKLDFDRTSASRRPEAWAGEEGTIDPYVRTLSFWNGDQPVLALSVYALHPMSYYGAGGVSADFVGMARKRRQGDDPGCLQIYASGCSGNVTAGKYNDGSPANRPVLADRMYQGMKKAWQDTKKHPLQSVAFRNEKLRLEPRNDKNHTIEGLQQRLHHPTRKFQQCLAALGLSWRKRADAGLLLDVPVIDLGAALVLLLPAEIYVEYQLLAQKMRPDAFVVTLGYGECAPGYIPTQKHIDEKDPNLGEWSWVAPGAEERLHTVMRKVLRGQ